MTDTIQRVCIYCRVSTDEQADKGLSIPAQLRECQAHAARQGWLITHTFEDPGFSGSNENRPGLQAMLAAAKNRAFDVLLVHKSDRLSRDEFFALSVKHQMQGLGIVIRSVTEAFVGGDHPSDGLVESVIRGANAFFIANLKQEIRKGIKEIADQGRQMGTPPYGYACATPGIQGGGWVVRPEQAVWVRRMYARVLDGAGVAQITRELNRAGVPTHKNVIRNWQTGTVSRILRSAVYCGRISLHGRQFPGTHEPIIDEDVWSRVQSVLITRPRKRSGQSDGLFVGGFLRCPKCGSDMVTHGGAWHVPGEDRAHYYRCMFSHNKAIGVSLERAVSDTCGGFYISQRKALRLLLDHLRAVAQSSVLPSPPALPARITRSVGAEADALLSEAANLSRARTRFQEQHAFGLMTIEQLAEALARIDGRMARVQEEGEALQQIAPPSVLSPSVSADLLTMLESDAALPLKRDRMRVVIEYAIVAEDKKSIEIVPRLNAF